MPVAKALSWIPRASGMQEEVDLAPVVEVFSSLDPWISQIKPCFARVQPWTGSSLHLGCAAHRYSAFKFAGHDRTCQAGSRLGSGLP